mgnify:CR=1 FL=1
MEIKLTDDFNEKIRIGEGIVTERKSIYNDELIEQLCNELSKCNSIILEKLGGVRSAFFLSVYDYWLIGSNAKEEIYLGLYEMSNKQKAEYVTHIGRLDYVRSINRADDEVLLRNKFLAYEKLKDYYHREVRILPADGYAMCREFIDNYGSCVIKPNEGSVSIGVRRISKDDICGDEKSFERMLKECSEEMKNTAWLKGENLLIEEEIKQSEKLAYLHPQSLNSVRITTVRTKTGINIFYPVIRIGVGGNFLCAGAVGSIIAGIDKNGNVCTDGYDEFGNHFIEHPDTHIVFKEISIPDWDKLTNMAQEVAELFPTLNYAGWDIGV